MPINICFAITYLLQVWLPGLGFCFYFTVVFMTMPLCALGMCSKAQSDTYYHKNCPVLQLFTFDTSTTKIFYAYHVLSLNPPLQLLSNRSSLLCSIQTFNISSAHNIHVKRKHFERCNLAGYHFHYDHYDSMLNLALPISLHRKTVYHPAAINSVPCDTVVESYL